MSDEARQQALEWNQSITDWPAVRQLSGARLGVGKVKCYDLSIHVMQAGRSNGDLSISMGPLLSSSQGFRLHHLPREYH